MSGPRTSSLGGSVTIEKLKARPEFYHLDLEDALTCALIGWSFRNKPDLLAHPTPIIDPSEGFLCPVMD